MNRLDTQAAIFTMDPLVKRPRPRTGGQPAIGAEKLHHHHQNSTWRARSRNYTYKHFTTLTFWLIQFDKRRKSRVAEFNQQNGR